MDEGPCRTFHGDVTSSIREHGLHVTSDFETSPARRRRSRDRSVAADPPRSPCVFARPSVRLSRDSIYRCGYSRKSHREPTDADREWSHGRREETLG